jgi:hypothetical protein
LLIDTTATTVHLPGPQNPGECHLYFAEECHLYIAAYRFCRRKIDMSPGLPSRDDTPIVGGHDQRDTGSQLNVGWGLSYYCR